jgi:copper transport protein
MADLSIERGIMKALLPLIYMSIVLTPAVALAHAHLVRSSPAENAVLEKSPPTATLVFAEPVTMTAVKIESAGGVKATLQPLPAGPTAELSVSLPTLVPGRYKMSWRAVSDDGHIMSGEIHFSVGGTGGH